MQALVHKELKKMGLTDKIDENSDRSSSSSSSDSDENTDDSSLDSKSSSKSQKKNKKKKKAGISAKKRKTKSNFPKSGLMHTCNMSM